MHDPDLEDWIAGLSGQRAPRAQGDDAAALREVILQRRLLRRLKQEGVLPEQSSATITNISRDSRVAAGRTPSRRYATPRVFALAASVAFLALGAGIILRMSHSGLSAEQSEQLRGFAGGVTLPSAQPQQTAADVQRELQAIGLTARRLPDTTRVVIEVSVATDQLAAFDTWMEAHGGVARAVGDYRIVIGPP
jgi:hypothetical protein